MNTTTTTEKPDRYAYRLRQQALREATAGGVIPFQGVNRSTRRKDVAVMRHTKKLEENKLFEKLRRKALNGVCGAHGNLGTVWWMVPAADDEPGGQHLLCNACVVIRVPGDRLIRVFEK